MKIIIGYALIEALCLTYCLGASLPQQTARDFIEHGLRIPNPEKVLNSVLGRLERNRQERLRAVSSEGENWDPNDLPLPEYTESIGVSVERGLRQLTAAQKHYPICHLERKIRRLNTNEYEYRPAYYEEVKCVPRSEEFGDTNEICSSLGFSCVQWNKTIHLTRRRYTSDCWETKTMVIPAGCECMWPVHQLGDMKLLN